MNEEFFTMDNHNTFGGLINNSDFCTDYEGTRSIADRIITDWKFDMRCKKNIEQRDKYKNYAW